MAPNDFDGHFDRAQRTGDVDGYAVGVFCRGRFTLLDPQRHVLVLAKPVDNSTRDSKSK